MKTIGSRAEVFHEKALKTAGGLKKEDLLKNKHGYIVSKRKVLLSKKSKTNPLMKQGYLAKKNSKKFGPLKNKPEKSLIEKLTNIFS